MNHKNPRKSLIALLFHEKQRSLKRNRTIYWLSHFHVNQGHETRATPELLLRYCIRYTTWQIFANAAHLSCGETIRVVNKINEFTATTALNNNSSRYLTATIFANNGGLMFPCFRMVTFRYSMLYEIMIRDTYW